MNHDSVNMQQEKFDNELTVPGKRDRKPDGRFVPGDLLLNRYKVLSELGRGGMGIVYKCFDETAGIEIALKVLPPELSHNSLEMEDVKENFQLIHNLHHPNIAASNNLEKDNTNGNYYLIMEFCSGEVLRRWIKRRRKEGTFDLNAVTAVIRQVADALDYAHAQNILHRDIKPENIIIDSAGKIKILDFGLAAQLHTSLFRLSLAYRGTSGTGPYMAPEQWRGHTQGAASDQYALAVMTYEMISGHPPFENPDSAVLQQIVLTQRPEKLANVPGFIQKAVAKAMSKEQADRFRSCSAFADALENKGSSFTFSRHTLRKWMPALALITLFLIASAGFSYYSFYQKKAVERTQKLVEQQRPAPKRNIAEPKKIQEKTMVTAEKKNTTSSQVIAVPENTQAESDRIIVSSELTKNDTAANERLERIKQQKINEENDQLALQRAAQEEKKKRLKRENYDLLYDLNKLHKELTAPGLAINFRARINSFNKNFKMGKEALGNSEHETANACLKDALKDATYIQNNKKFIAEYQHYKRELESLFAQKRDGRKLDASALAAFKRTVTAAEECYTKGTFSESVAMLRKAIRDYHQMIKAADLAQLKLIQTEIQNVLNRKNWNAVKIHAEKLQFFQPEEAAKLIRMADAEIRKEKIEKLLQTARTALQQKEFSLAKRSADTLLSIAPDHSEARKIRDKLIHDMRPILKLVIMTEGKKTAAKISFNDPRITVSKDNIFTGFVKNSRYFCSVFAEKDQKKFYRAIEFKCDWYGEKTITLAMNELQFSSIELAQGVILEMAEIKPGTFMMGSDPGTGVIFAEGEEIGRRRNETLHQVTISRKFWLGKYEVTQKQFQQIMGFNPSRYPKVKHPVEQVSWHDAKKFCEILNRRFSHLLPSGYRFDLPTEAQWEYACRAETTTALNSGKNLELRSRRRFCVNLDKLGWFAYNSRKYGHRAVGRKAPNKWGLYDMHGNIMEWCRDWYDDLEEKTALDPTGPGSGTKRVLRGGSWSHHPQLCRSATRLFYAPSTKAHYIGFRIALVPTQQ